MHHACFAPNGYEQIHGLLRRRVGSKYPPYGNWRYAHAVSGSHIRLCQRLLFCKQKRAHPKQQLLHFRKMVYNY